jgi:hypothetical protein
MTGGRVMAKGSTLKQFVLMGLCALAHVLGLWHPEPKRREISLPTTDGTKLYTWIYSY